MENYFGNIPPPFGISTKAGPRFDLLMQYAGPERRMRHGAAPGIGMSQVISHPLRSLQHSDSLNGQTPRGVKPYGKPLKTDGSVVG